MEDENMKKNTAIKSLLAAILLSTSMMLGLGYNTYENQKEIDKLNEERNIILNDHSELILDLEDELNSYKNINVELNEKIDLKNSEIEELNKQVVVKQEESKNKVSVSRGEHTSVGDWIVYEATHYSAFCNTGCTGITAMGYDVRRTIYEQGYRVIAVDPSKIKLGSLVEVKTSYDTFLALAGDTGGAIKGYRIDILVENDNMAYKLGREKVQVRIIK